MDHSLNKIKKITIDGADNFFDIKFHPKHENLVVTSNINGNIVMVDLNAESSSVVLTLEKHHKGSAIRKVCLPNENLLISAAKSVKLFDLNRGKVLRKIDNNNCKISSLLVIDEYLIAFGDDEGNFKVYDYRVDRGVYMELKQFEEFISDLDIDSDKRVIVASSGEGTLCAFNFRARKMIEPKSELFDTGFNCIRYVEEKNRVVVGTEDSAINIFNIGEWGNLSDRIPIKTNHSRTKGFCTVDFIELIADDKIIVATSDGKIRIINIFPNKQLCEKTTPEESVEALAINQNRNKIVIGENDSLYVYDYVQTPIPKDEVKKGRPVNEFFSDL